MLLRHILIMLSALLPFGAAAASDSRPATDAVRTSDVDIVTSDDNFFIRMTVDLSGYKRLERNREVIITPMIVDGADSLALPSLVVAGRSRYYLWLRQSSDRWPADKLYRASDGAVVDYQATVAAEKWMETSDLVISALSRGCCGTPETLAAVPVTTISVEKLEPAAFMPQFVFIRPEAELEKHRQISGSAYIDFPVDQTVIYPDYRRNTVELARIRATIDSVRDDADVTIAAVALKGFASPESPYSHNTELAIGRTESLRRYINQLYSFPAGVVVTDYEPEDWAGLRRFVDRSNIDNRDDILAIIDSDLAPDPKEARIKSRYPAQYRFMLQNWYPALRHTDYKIDYTVRQYTDPEEMRKVLFSAPQKLSLNEMFAAASTMEPGTPDYDEAFAIAVRMYPDSPEANLNAAIAAMKTARLDAACAYLAKAGDSPEAVYARGLYEAFSGNYDAARPLLRQALDSGIQPAADALQQIDNIQSFVK